MFTIYTFAWASSVALLISSTFIVLFSIGRHLKQYAAQPSSTNTNLQAPEKIPMGAKDVYSFRRPLVMERRVVYMQVIKIDGATGNRPHRPLSSPSHTYIVTPKNDRSYSYATVGIGVEPGVLTTPRFEKEGFYASQSLYGVKNLGVEYQEDLPQIAKACV